jgi:hypothetical protein
MNDVTSPTSPAAASDAVLSRRHGTALRRALPLLASAATVAVTVAACSSWSSMTGGAAPEPAAATPPAPSEGSFTSRVKSFFSSGDSGKLSSPPPSSTTGAAAASAEVECPNVEYRQGAATWAVNGPATENAALSVKYQVSFLQAARECIATGGNLTVKVGVQGRIVLGPAGGPGTLNVPLRYALVREGLEPKTLWTKLFMVPVSIEPGQLNLPWVHVEEEMTVPRPSAQDQEALVIYIGFDPDGASAKPAKAAVKPKTARTR